MTKTVNPNKVQLSGVQLLGFIIAILMALVYYSNRIGVIWRRYMAWF
jgi:hypothetical protein